MNDSKNNGEPISEYYPPLCLYIDTRPRIERQYQKILGMISQGQGLQDLLDEFVVTTDEHDHDSHSEIYDRRDGHIDSDTINEETIDDIDDYEGFEPSQVAADSETSEQIEEPTENPEYSEYEESQQSQEESRDAQENEESLEDQGREESPENTEQADRLENAEVTEDAPSKDESNQESDEEAFYEEVPAEQIADLLLVEEISVTETVDLEQKMYSREYSTTTPEFEVLGA